MGASAYGFGMLAPLLWRAGLGISWQAVLVAGIALAGGAAVLGVARWLLGKFPLLFIKHARRYDVAMAGLLLMAPLLFYSRHAFVVLPPGELAFPAPSSAEKLLPEGAPFLVVLITVDTLRRDHLSLYGYPHNTSPNVDRFFHRGVIFENAVTPKTLTAPAVASILTGVYPRRHHVFTNGQHLADWAVTMAEKFQGAGFCTGAFVSNILLYHPSYKFSQGFQRFVKFDEALLATSYDEARRIVTQALRFMKEQSGPCFVWLHFMEPHDPYTPPAPYDTMFFVDAPYTPLKLSEGQKQRLLGHALWESVPEDLASNPHRWQALYDGEIRYLDSQMAPLFDYLETQPQALVVFTADHGETMDEHRPVFDHGYDCYDACARVPLFFRYATLSGPRRMEHLVSTVDIAPTLYAGAGLAPAPHLDGRNLWPLLQGKTSSPDVPVVWIEGARATRHTQYAARTLEWKLVMEPLLWFRFADAVAGLRFLSMFDWPRTMDYALRSYRSRVYHLTLDPDEQVDVIDQHPETAHRLRTALTAWLKQTSRYRPAFEPPGEPISTQDLSPQEIEILKSHGYLR
ncbi:MAG: sulfatase [Acidobacteriota bacterium]|nr:MAG: sulfatase [Acidobacteriota bacterium]